MTSAYFSGTNIWELEWRRYKRKSCSLLEEYVPIIICQMSVIFLVVLLRKYSILLEHPTNRIITVPSAVKSKQIYLPGELLFSKVCIAIRIYSSIRVPICMNATDKCHYYKNIVVAVGVTRRIIRLHFPIKIVKQVHSSGTCHILGILYNISFFCSIREIKLS